MFHFITNVTRLHNNLNSDALAGLYQYILLMKPPVIGSVNHGQ